ncbi:MAG: FtsX-like permease family protein [Longimicrobiales bacterium]
MSLLRRASVRHLLRHPAQVGLSVLGVALGVAVVVSIDLAIQSARVGFRVSAETVAGRATHHVSGGLEGLDESLLARLRVDVGVEAAAPVVEGLASADALPGMALRVVGVDPFSEGPFRPYLAGGPAGLDVGALITTAYGAVVASGTAERAGLGAGDSLVVMVDGRRVPLPLVGVLDPADELARAGLRDLVVMDVASAQVLVGRPGRLDRIDLRLPAGPDGEELVRRIADVLPPDARLEPAGTRTDTLSGMIAAFDLNLTALSFLALVFGMFLIYNAQTFSVVQRRELLGGLRALGVTRGEVLRTVLLEAAAIGVAGAALGVGLGVLLGRGLVRMVTRTINDLYFVVSVDSLVLPPEVLLKGVVMGIGATLLAAAAPALEAASAPPRMARTRSAVEDRARRAVPRAAAAGAVMAVAGGALLLVPTRSLVVSFAGLFMVLLGMALGTPLGTVVLVRWTRPLLARGAGILGTMASRGVVTALSRTAPAIAALVVAVSVTVGLGIMIQSFRGTLVDWLDGTLQADVYVSLPSVQAARADGTLPPGLVAALSAHPDVMGRSTYRGVQATLDDGPVQVVALDLHPRGEAAFDFLEGDAGSAFPAFREGGAVIVSEPFAFRRGVGPGDTVRLAAPGGEVAFPVAGVFYDYAAERGVVMMSRTTYDRHWDDPGVTSLGLFLEEGADMERTLAGMEALVPEGLTVSIRTNRALREGSLEVFDRTFQVTAVLRLLAFVVAFVGVLSALMALELERARELGVLRANGLTPGQVWHLVTTQTGLMGLVAGLLAVPMGLVLAVVMIHVVNKRSFGWTLQMEVGPEVVWQAVGLAVVGALLAGVFPAWKMSRTSPAEALRGE